MSELQRTRLLAIAAKYPQLKPEEQKRFQKRLIAWSSLTREQRELARRNYKKLKRLPPSKQQVVKREWLAKHPVKPAEQPALAEQTPPLP